MSDATDTPDAKLIAERTRLVALLAHLANALVVLPPERLAEVLPGMQGVDELVRRARGLGVQIPGPLPRDPG